MKSIYGDLFVRINVNYCLIYYMFEFIIFIEGLHDKSSIVRWLVRKIT